MTALKRKSPKKPVKPKPPKKPVRRWRVCASIACERGEDGGPKRFLGSRQYCCNACKHAATRARNPNADPRKGERQRYVKGTGRKGTQVPNLERRVQEHGGTLGGSKGNPRGHPRKALRALARQLAGTLGAELVERLGTKQQRKKLSVNALGKMYTDVMKVAVGTPMQIKHSGGGLGGAIGVAVVGPWQQATPPAAETPPE